MTAAATQKAVARTEAAAVDAAARHALEGEGYSAVQGLFAEAARTGDRNTLAQAEQAYAAMPINSSVESKRMRDQIKPQEYRDQVEAKQAGFVTEKLINIDKALAAEEAKPAEKQNPAAIAALRNTRDEAIRQSPKAADDYMQLRTNEFDLKQKVEAAQAGDQLKSAQADMSRMLANNTPMEEIKQKIGEKYPLAVTAESFDTLERYQAAAEKITNRENTAAAVASLPTELKELVDAARLDENTKALMKKDIDFLMKDRELLPNQALKRAEEFAQRIAGYELGVNRDKAAAEAEENAKYKSLVHRVRLQRTTQVEMDRAWEAYDAAVREATKLGSMSTWGNEVDYTKVKGLADAMRMAESGLEEFTPYVFENGMPQFDPKTGQPLMKEDFDHADIFDVQSFADPSASQGTYVPPQTNDDTQSARRERQRGVVGSNQTPAPEQPSTLDAVNDVLDRP